MDDHPVVTPPRSSVEKLEDRLAQLTELKGEDAGQSMILNSLKAMLPALRKLGYIPDDADELDRLLLIGAQFALELRSDDAAVRYSLEWISGVPYDVSADEIDIPDEDPS